MLARWMMLLGLALAGCDELIEEECDAYVDYVCTCDQTVDCDALAAQLSGGTADEQETCRLDLTCYESADTTAGGTCSEFGEDALGECDP